MKKKTGEMNEILRAVYTIRAKRELLNYLPLARKSYDTIEEWSNAEYFYDAERYTDDATYRKEVNEMWESYEEEAQIFNEVLLKLYEVIS